MSKEIIENKIIKEFEKDPIKLNQKINKKINENFYCHPDGLKGLIKSSIEKVKNSKIP